MYDWEINLVFVIIRIALFWRRCSYSGKLRKILPILEEETKNVDVSACDRGEGK